MAQLPDYKFTSDQIKEALVQSRGNMSQAARLLTETSGETCRRAYVKEACDSRPELLKFYHDMREEFVDQAETNIFDAVLAGDVQISLKVAATLGKDRGWAERKEVELTDPEGSVNKILEARARAKAARRGSSEESSPAPEGPGEEAG